MLATLFLAGWTMLPLSASPPPRPNPYLSQAKVLFQGLEPKKALARLNKAEKWRQTSELEQAEIHLYRGLCRFQLSGNETDARADFRRAVLIHPDVKLPPHTSPKVQQLFEAVYEAERPVSAPPVVEALPPPAPEDTPLRAEKRTPPDEEAAFVSPAFAKPDTSLQDEPMLAVGKRHWPWVTAAVAAAGLAGTATYLGLSARADARGGQAERFAVDADRLRQQANTKAQASTVLFAAAGGAAAVGVALYFVF